MKLIHRSKMTRIILISIIFSLILAVYSVNIPENSLNTKFDAINVEDLEEYFKANPQKKHLSLSIADEAPKYQLKSFKIGKRLAGK